jgi:putative copper export protein
VRDVGSGEALSRWAADPHAPHSPAPGTPAQTWTVQGGGPDGTLARWAADPLAPRSPAVGIDTVTPAQDRSGAWPDSTGLEWSWPLHAAEAPVAGPLASDMWVGSEDDTLVDQDLFDPLRPTPPWPSSGEVRMGDADEDVPVLPYRSGWTRFGWALRDLAIVAGLVLAVVGAWVVLVNLRGPEPEAATDQLAMRLDRTVAESLRADRVASFGTWIVDVTTTLALGGVVFRSVIATAQRRVLGWSPARFLRMAAFVGMVASVAVVPFRAAAIAGTGRIAVLDPDTLRFVATSRFGNAALLRVAGLLLIAVAVGAPTGQDDDGIRPRGVGRALDHVLSAGGGLLLLASYAWIGHPQAASAGGEGTLLVLGQLVHVLAVSTWFAGVVLLYLQIRAGRRVGAVRTSAEVVERFSTVAGGALALAAVTGVLLAQQQVTSVSALMDTPYGRALAVKLTLVALVAAIGGYNKLFVVPRVVDMSGAVAWRTLHRTLLAEATVIAAGVLLATTTMISGGF